MTSGGPSGCVVALLPHDLVAPCQAALAAQYRAPNGMSAEIYLPNISAGASHRALSAQGRLLTA